MPIEFKLPELGENVESGDVLRVMVSPGDAVEVDQPVLELETDKATIEVPSSVRGTVKELKVKAGDKVKVGQPILVVEESGPAKTGARPTPAAAAATQPTGSAETAEERRDTKPVESQKTAEGKPAEDEDAHEERAADANEEDQAADTSRKARRGEVVDISRGARPAAEPAPAAASAQPAAPAAPSVRRLARELGVDINDVPGSGPGGRISLEDVKAFAKSLIAGAGAAARVPGLAVKLPDFTKWGDIERKPMTSVRRKTSEHLTHAWTTIPHVTQYDRADISNLEELRRRFAKKAEEAGGNLTVTAILLKVVAEALKVFPQFNASIDLENEEIIFKKYVHVGVAVDTDRGLLVPVIRDVDTKSLIQLSVDLTGAAERARTRKLALEDMQGGSFTVTNLGGIGGTAFSPIINTPEVAILGVARASLQPIFINGQFQARLMLPLCLSYDHRVIDGADAIRFLRWIVDALEQPFFLSLQSEEST